MTGSVSHSGRCLCGAVSFEVTGVPQIVAHCFCLDCQRLTGAGHSTGAMFQAENLALSGAIGEFQLESDNGNTVTRVFCPACGSPLYGRNTGMSGFITISLGCLDNSDDFEPVVAVFGRNRKKWDLIDPSIETFEAQPQWQPDD